MDFRFFMQKEFSSNQDTFSCMFNNKLQLYFKDNFMQENIFGWKSITQFALLQEEH